MADFSLDQVNEMYMDVLKEIGNIGAGNATTAIAGMLGMRLDMKVPSVLFKDAAKLSDAICPEDTPEQLAKQKDNFTGRYLKEELDAMKR